MLGESNLKWTHVQELLGDFDFISSILHFATAPRQVKRVTANHLDRNDDLSFEAVMILSKTCGPLYKWAES